MARHEKTKSGGFLDGFFGRPKKGQRMHSSGGDVNDITTNDLITEIQSWDSKELNEKFLDILEDMNIPADKREPLLSKDVREKREMLLMHYKGKLIHQIFSVLLYFFSLL